MRACTYETERGVSEAKEQRKEIQRKAETGNFGVANSEDVGQALRGLM